MAKASFTGVLVIKSRKLQEDREAPNIGIAIKAFNVAKTRSDIIKFHTLHKECLAPIRHENVCTKCDKPVSEDLQVKGYQNDEGPQFPWITATEEDLAGLKLEPEEGRPIYIQTTVKQKEINPIWLSQSYFLVPQDDDYKAASSYTLFARPLGED